MVLLGDWLIYFGWLRCFFEKETGNKVLLWISCLGGGGDLLDCSQIKRIFSIGEGFRRELKGTYDSSPPEDGWVGDATCW